MAKQIAGLCRLEGTFDQLTFYKMDGQYYVRVKSRLTAKRVKTSPEFKLTMVCANLLARASRIGSLIYKALPPGWRQFWMYRGFTGEAFTLLKKNPYTDEEVKDLLWKCYVEYWEQRKAIELDNPIWQPKPKKIRKRRKYSEESLKRLMYRKDKYGRYKYPDLVKADKQRIACEAKEAWAKECEDKKRIRLIKARNEAYTRLMDKYRQAQQETITRLSGLMYITPAGNLYSVISPQIVNHYERRLQRQKMLLPHTITL
jgi:hypothetical protein